MIVGANPPHFTIEAVSDTILLAFGLNRNDVPGRYFFDIFSANNTNAVQVLSSSFNEVIESRQPGAVAAYPLYLPTNATSEVSYWSATNVPVVDEQGNVAYIVHTPVNVTAQIVQKQQQAAKMLNMQLQQDRMNELFMKAPIGVAFLNRSNFIIEYANTAICQMWNHERPEEVLGKPALDVVIEAAELRLILEKVLRTGKAFVSDDTPVLLSDHIEQRTSYFDLIFEPLRDTEEHVTGIIAIAVDVTEKVEARLKLEDAEQRLRLATESTGLGTWDLDLKTGAIIYSPRLAEIFGQPTDVLYTREQLREAIHHDDIELVQNAFNHALKTGMYFYEVRIFWPNGALRWIRTTGSVVYNFRHEPVRMLGTINDVTAQRELIEELKASEENLRLATEAAELGTFDLDLVKHTMDWDKRCRELFGIYDMRPVNYNDDFLGGLHQDDRDRVAAVIEQAMNKEQSNGDYDVEYRTVGFSDKKVRWIRAKGKVFFGEHDKPERFMGAVLDITENKLNEIRKNDFIAMASHELKTPLTSLKAYIQLLAVKARKSGDEFLISSLQKSENQVNKMTSLIYGFLDLSKIETGKLQLDNTVFDINGLITEVVAESAPIAPAHKITVVPGDNFNVSADREKISQVLVNLISNAVKYSPKQSTIYIAAIREGDSVKVTVTDEGIGIDPQHQLNIFQRFYRVDTADTKGFSGFGIGLYLSAEIIQLHKGTIGVTSEEGEGSTFYFTLPLAT